MTLNPGIVTNSEERTKCLPCDSDTLIVICVAAATARLVCAKTFSPGQLNQIDDLGNPQDAK